MSVFMTQSNVKTRVFHRQGFPEFGDDEIVSVPDAKYTKGEFEVCTPTRTLRYLWDVSA